MGTNRDVVFTLWCRLTGQEPAELSADEQAGFFARSQIAELSAAPYALLLDAGISAANRGSLPLERWLGDVRTLQSATVRSPQWEQASV